MFLPGRSSLPETRILVDSGERQKIIPGMLPTSAQFGHDRTPECLQMLATLPYPHASPLLQRCSLLVCPERGKWVPVQVTGRGARLKDAAKKLPLQPEEEQHKQRPSQCHSWGHGSAKLANHCTQAGGLYILHVLSAHFVIICAPVQE